MVVQSKSTEATPATHVASLNSLSSQGSVDEADASPVRGVISSIFRVNSRPSVRRHESKKDTSFSEKVSLKRAQTKERLADIVGFLGNTPAADDGQEDEEEEAVEAEEEEDLRFNAVAVKPVESMVERAHKVVGIASIADDVEPLMLRLQRCTGILWFRIFIVVKRMEQEEAMKTDHSCIGRIVKSLNFETLIGLMIVLNAISIGWETFYEDGEDRPFLLDASEHVFTLLFLIEFLLRIQTFSWVWIFDWANLFDTFLIWVTGVLVMWVLLPAGIDATVLRRFACLRILRLARLCKCVRIIPMFKELWILVQGVMECASLLIWTLVIGGILHFMFAVAILELVAKAEKFENDVDVQDKFGSVPSGMYTLFQIMTFDSWANIVRPIVQAEPITMLLFGLFMGLAGIVLFNLMTAIVVRKAFDGMDADEEAVAQAKHFSTVKSKRELQAMFFELDEDHSGTLTQEEFSDCLDDFAFIRKLKMLDISVEDLPDIFAILDDGDGLVDQSEFINGMMELQGGALSREVLKATTMMQKQNFNIGKLQNHYEKNCTFAFENVSGEVQRMHEGMNDLMQLTAEIVARIDRVGVRLIFKATAKNLPQVSEPDLEELAKEDARKRRRSRLGIAEPQEEESLPEGALQKPLPVAWLANGGANIAKRIPNKAKLLEDQKLKERLLEKRRQHQRAQQRKALAHRKPRGPVGVRRELGPSWEALKLPVSDPGQKGSLLQQSAIVAIGTPPATPPVVVAALPPGLVSPTSRPRPQLLQLPDPEARQATPPPLPGTLPEVTAIMGVAKPHKQQRPEEAEGPSSPYVAAASTAWSLPAAGGPSATTSPSAGGHRQGGGATPDAAAAYATGRHSLPVGQPAAALARRLNRPPVNCGPLLQATGAAPSAMAAARRPERRAQHPKVPAPGVGPPQLPRAGKAPQESGSSVV